MLSLGVGPTAPKMQNLDGVESSGEGFETTKRFQLTNTDKKKNWDDQQFVGNGFSYEECSRQSPANGSSHSHFRFKNKVQSLHLFVQSRLTY